MKKHHIFFFCLGVLMVALVFFAYVFVVPPFYGLAVSMDSRVGSIHLNPDEERSVFWSAEVGDFNYTVDLYFISDELIEILVYLDTDLVFTKIGTDISELVQEECPLRQWLGGLESGPGVWRAHDISVDVKNLSSERTHISFSCDLVSHGRISSVFLDMGLVVAGLLILVTAILQAWSAKKRLPP